MKRFSAKLIAMMLCCLMVVSLAACDKDLSGGALSSLTKPNSSPVEPEILVTDPPAAVDVQIPFGYVEYNDGFVSFAYPEGWVIIPVFTIP